MAIMLCGIVFGLEDKAIPQCYIHEVLNGSDNGLIALEMKYLYDEGYTTITIKEFEEMRDGTLAIPEKPIVITFDDGLKSVMDNGVPLMEKYGMKGVIAYPTGKIWKEKMTYDNLTYLQSKGWEIASHSITHINLYEDTKDKNRWIKELNESRQAIYANTSIMPEYFVFPENGANQEITDLCLTMYNDCSGNNSRNNNTAMILHEDKRLGLSRIYCGEPTYNITKNNQQTASRLKNFKYRLNESIRHAEKIISSTTIPIIPTEINTTINGYNYTCTLR